MKIQTKAKIFIADERGCYEDECSRSYSTFNSGTFFNEHKQAFNDLYAFKDETIAASCSKLHTVEENAHLLLLPVVGTLLCKINSNTWSIVNVGQLQIFKLRPGDTIEILNCYKNELVNFIFAGIKAEDNKSNDFKKLFAFNLNEHKNELIGLAKSGGHNNYPFASIGKFSGRGEGIYHLQQKRNNLFVFVVEGVFEVDGKLLHAKDGLAIWDSPEQLELEALSNDAIIFFIEMIPIINHSAR
jgi:hypothetical protein